MNWWEMDEVNMVATFLDGRSLAAFTCCKAIRSNLRSRDTLRWIAELRGLDPKSIASVEHIQLAETMAELSSSIFFGWGSLEVDDGALPSLRNISTLLARHKSLSLYIEAHCGLEARINMPLPGQARQYTRARAHAVRRALMLQAASVGVEVEAERVVTRAWGCARPLVWAFADDFYDDTGLYVDAQASGRNRRVELYLRSGAFEVPKRRRRSEIPVEPGTVPLVDRADNTLSDDETDESLALDAQMTHFELNYLDVMDESSDDVSESDQAVSEDDDSESDHAVPDDDDSESDHGVSHEDVSEV
mmetsp:Transcript_34756/g.50909  ORF Transcript_34756/g.50909 Transcript_34756/m.50909 type:complete len:304 (+) Transcript_34756:1-912(+)